MCSLGVFFIPGCDHGGGRYEVTNRSKKYANYSYLKPTQAQIDSLEYSISPGSHGFRWNVGSLGVTEGTNLSFYQSEAIEGETSVTVFATSDQSGEKSIPTETFILVEPAAPVLQVTMPRPGQSPVTGEKVYFDDIALTPVIEFVNPDSTEKELPKISKLLFVRKSDNGFGEIKEIGYNKSFYIKVEYNSEPEEKMKTVTLDWGDGADEKRPITVTQQKDKKIYLSDAIYAKRPE